MSSRKAAHVVFNGHPGRYKAVPPTHKTHPDDTEVCFRNLTGSSVLVWFPGNFLDGSPAAIESGATRCFPIGGGAVAGTYTYAAQVTPSGEFIEGNSPPEIIIDR